MEGRTTVVVVAVVVVPGIRRTRDPGTLDRPVGIVLSSSRVISPICDLVNPCGLTTKTVSNDDDAQGTNRGFARGAGDILKEFFILTVTIRKSPRNLRVLYELSVRDFRSLVPRHELHAALAIQLFSLEGFCLEWMASNSAGSNEK